MEKQDPLIHPDTGNEIQKWFYISVPYFPGLSESYKEDLQIHSSTSMFQRSQHPEVNADAPKGQDLQQPKEGSSLSLGV